MRVLCLVVWRLWVVYLISSCESSRGFCGVRSVLSVNGFVVVLCLSVCVLVIFLIGCYVFQYSC